MNRIKEFCLKHKQFCFYSLLVAGIVFTAVFAPVIATHDPYKAPLTEAFQKPGSDHLFGTDAMGRDVFSRVIYGTRTSVFSVLILVAITFLTGTILGMAAGYFGGVTDMIIMRFADMMISFPDLILAIAIAGILGPSLTNSVIAIAAVSWTKYARLARSLVLKIKKRTYIAAANVNGSSHMHILYRYMFPNALPTLIITAATDIGTMMLALASLSFMGFGAASGTPEWGYMLSEGRTHILTSPWLLFCPAAAVFVVVVIFNLWGDSLRDLIDPKTTKVRRKKKMNLTFSVKKVKTAAQS